MGVWGGGIFGGKLFSECCLSRGGVVMRSSKSSLLTLVTSTVGAGVGWCGRCAARWCDVW